MTRTARLLLPDYSHHILQSGHNREVVFSGEEDDLYDLENPAEWKDIYHCKVYAFCLMTNHIHKM